MTILTQTVKYRGQDIPVSEMKPGSGKKILVRCPSCGQVRKTWIGVILRRNNHKCHQCTLKERAQILKEGSRYGRWTVLRAGEKVGKSRCQCECGTVRDVDNHTLRSGASKSCGCWSLDERQKRCKRPAIGTRYGMLVVISLSKRSGYSICRCSCGTVLERHNGRLRAGVTKSCGCLQREVLREHHFIASGKEHPNWQGGITSENVRIRCSTKYADWRSKVFERDSFTCQKCGQLGGKLHAHHIEGFAENEGKRTDADNGITFCYGCHRAFHALYGRKNNNRMIRRIH